MTREEAIHFAECLKNNWTINFADMEEFCDMAIEALSADAVKVVRCKDCKHWHSNTEFCSIWSFHFQNVAQRTLSHDYCSRGERREDGEA